MLAMGRAPDPSGRSDVVAVVHGLESLLRRLASTNLKLEVLTAKEPVLALGNRAHLEMALVNLVSNARDATQRGSITITVEPRSVSAGDRYASQGVPPGRWACLEVRDTGSGMSKELTEKVFKAFFTTKGAKGTGLGLAQVADFAQQAGGRAVIESEEGKGTTVTLLLRLA
jgi:signal transduction histidine kinase